MVDTQLWGKSKGLTEPYTLVGHLIDTAMIAGAVWGEVLTAAQRTAIAAALGVGEPQARQLVMFWAGLHDLGKILPGFQEAAAQDRPGGCQFLQEARYGHDRDADGKAHRIRHEEATNLALPQLLAQEGYSVAGILRKLLLSQVAQILGGHHGRYPERVEAGVLREPLLEWPELGRGGWTEERREHLAAVHEVTGRPEAPPADAMPVTLATVLTGVVIVSDWLASQDRVVLRQQAAANADGGLASPEARRAHAERARKLGPELVREAGLGRAAFATGSFAQLFPKIRHPHDLQASVETGLADAPHGPGLLLVTAPTGEGKTEAALYAAARMGEMCGSSGLYFALPTRATANQMYGRVMEFAGRNLLDPAQVALLHGGAELVEAYADGGRGGVEDRVLSEDGAGRDSMASVAGRWLRQRGRGLLAPVAVGTIDQALMGVLPLRRNALRHLGLSGKTVVVDEAHSYDAFTHALLLRLLEWLGALRVPVVLLSATLTGDTATGLVQAYRSGAGHPEEAEQLPAPSYPGWLYADAATGKVTTPARAVESGRPRTLSVEVLPVQHTYDADVAHGRLAVLLRELEGVWESGGCAAVICTTVAEAQLTFEALRAYCESRYGPGWTGWDDRLGEAPGEGPWLRLLHARFPAARRDSITAEAERWFGKPGEEGVQRPSPPRGAVLVATQVIEQSLDLDFDLIVSDLAPLALLLQRAGRVWRHDRPTRPDWCSGARLAVLTPLGEDTRRDPPQAWGDVYAPALLQRTQELLQRHGSEVKVPEQVQMLVDEVYNPEFVSADPESLFKRDIDRLGDDMARSGLAGMVMLPSPGKLRSLYQLTTSDADEDVIATRLGADSVQTLPVFEDGQGHRWLDEECSVRLPEEGSGDEGRFTLDEARQLLSYVVPLADGPWRRACGPAHTPPEAWQAEPRLARLVLLPHRVTPDGTVGTQLDGKTYTLVHELGLTVRRT